MEQLFSLKNKRILVTGASSGIGRASAELCARLGATVIATGRNEDRLSSLVSSLDVACGQQHSYFVADFSNQVGVCSLVEWLPEVDGISDNAGMTNGNKPIKFIKRTELDQVIEINTLAHVTLLTQLFKKKKIAKNGAIVVTASIGGNFSRVTGQASYGMSKAALKSFAEYCAIEFSTRGIRCNSVCPGMINTPLIGYDTMTDEERKADAEKYLLKRYGNPEEVANVIAFLLSDASSYMTGTSVIVDGGYSINH